MSTAIDHAEATRLFWRQHLRIAFFVLAGESLGGALYFATTSGRYRPVLLVIAVSSALAAILTIVVVVDRVSYEPWRETFSFSWTLVSGLLLTIVAILDGGFESPMLILVPLPVVFATLAFSPDRVACCGGVALLELALVRLLGAGPPHEGDMLIWTSGGVGLTWLAFTAATNRSRLEAREAALGAELALLATTDSLTGCLNHRTFTERLEEEISRAVRHEWPLTVLVADIDNFKHINDTFGHPAGDQVLVTVAEALNGDMRTGDFVGRLGGDEFAIALPNTALDGGSARAQRIQQLLSRSTALPATVSIGISALDTAAPSVRALLEAADRGLYHVKHTGRAGIAMMTEGRSTQVA